MLCIALGARTLAQHVVAEGQARALARNFLRLANGLAEDKLFAQQGHGAQRGCHHGACAQLGDQAGLGVGIGGQKMFAHADGGR